jgi:hypothetical protein
MMSSLHQGPFNASLPLILFLAQKLLSKMPTSGIRPVPECQQTDRSNLEKTCGAEYEPLLDFRLLPDLLCASSAKEFNCTSDREKKSREKVCPILKAFNDCAKQVEFTCKNEEDILGKDYENIFNLAECAKSDSQGLSFMMPWTLFLLFFV